MFNLKFLAMTVLIFACNPSYAQSEFADPDQTPLTVEKLEQGTELLRVDLLKIKDRKEKLQLLSDFHKALRLEIKKRSMRNIRDEVYWRAIDLDVTIINLLEQNCATLKTLVLNSERNSTTNDQGLISEDTQKAISLTEAACQ
jgi:hypothetical protein